MEVAVGAANVEEEVPGEEEREWEEEDKGWEGFIEEEEVGGGKKKEDRGDDEREVVRRLFILSVEGLLAESLLLLLSWRGLLPGPLT